MPNIIFNGTTQVGGPIMPMNHLVISFIILGIIFIAIIVWGLRGKRDHENR